VIIGNEYKPEPESSGGNSWSFAQDEIKADLYIILAALELDALIKTFIKSLEDVNITDYKLPFVIQEVYNAANMTLLPDKYMSSSAHKLWTSMNQRVPAAIIPGYIISSTHYDLPSSFNDDSSSQGSLMRTGSFLRKVCLIAPFALLTCGQMVSNLEDEGALGGRAKVNVEQTILLSSPAYAQVSPPLLPSLLA
jgi:hypothetical protein